MATGVCRVWHAEEGWGIIDSPETPGGCWAHFSALAMPGYKELHPGQEVRFISEAARQDGYDWRAAAVTVDGSEPVIRRPESDPSGAYLSSLRIEWD